MDACAWLMRALFLSLPPVTHAVRSFITIGDWGAAALGSYHTVTVKTVAEQMAATASDASASFVVNTGDNFYYCGITTPHDFQVHTDFSQPYSSRSLNLPWYSVLGNHEYGYDVPSQIELAKTSIRPKWVMDDRYYTRRLHLEGSAHASFIFIDTSPCVADYRSSDPSGWDPCSSEFPTCAPIDEGACGFHKNILSQDCSKQFVWFKGALEAVPAEDWLVVVGHHPIDEVDVEDFASVLQAHGFDLYLNGHAHTLSQYTVDGSGAYVTSGAGGMVPTKDQSAKRTAVKVRGGDLLTNSTLAVGSLSGGTGGHSYETVWNDKIAGFTLHSFSDDYRQLRTEYISYEGHTLHSFTVSKTARRIPISS